MHADIRADGCARVQASARIPLCPPIFRALHALGQHSLYGLKVRGKAFHLMLLGIEAAWFERCQFAHFLWRATHIGSVTDGFLNCSK